MNRLPGPAPVEAITQDGLTLRGQSWGASARAVVLLHEEGADLDSLAGLVPDLVALGARVVAFDLRGHGASDDPWNSGHVHVDAEAAFRFVRATGAERVLGVGAGIGATGLLLAAAAAGPVAAIVALGPAAVPDALDPDAIRVARMPRLIVAGSRSPDAEVARAIVRRSIGRCILETPPVPERGAALLGSDWGDHVREHLLMFLRRSGAAG